MLVKCHSYSCLSWHMPHKGCLMQIRFSLLWACTLSGSKIVVLMHQCDIRANINTELAIFEKWWWWLRFSSTQRKIAMYSCLTATSIWHVDTVGPQKCTCQELETNSAMSNCKRLAKQWHKLWLCCLQGGFFFFFWKMCTAERREMKVLKISEM